MKFAVRKFILRFIPHEVIRFARKKINLNYFLFGPSQKGVGTYLINDTNSRFLLYGMEQELGNRVVEGFETCYEEYRSKGDLLRKYIVAIENCIIEPHTGWAITQPDGKLVFDSIANNSWRENYHPSYTDYRKGKAMAEEIDEAVSINIIRGGEDNYWHFMHDLLGEVALALKHLPPGIPFLISKNLSEKKYFKQALSQSNILGDQTWIIRDKKYYRVKKCWFIQTMLNANEQFFGVQNLLQIGDSDIHTERKIFLTRSTNRIRFLKNAKEIEEIAKSHGFEIIDTDGMNLQDQVSLFSSSRYVVGIHGAGLTNVIYRKNAPMALLELLPGDYLQPHYFWLSKGMGHQYQCLVGTVAAVDTSFKIDPVSFEEKLLQILSA